MKIFGYGNEPSLELVIFVVRFDFIECPGKGAYGDILCIVLIFGAKQLKTVNIVPKSVKKCAKGNLVSFFCLLNNLLDGIVGFFQKMSLT